MIYSVISTGYRPSFLREWARHPFSLSPLRLFLRRSSSVSSPKTDGVLSFFSARDGGSVEGSIAYRQLMLRRPETVRPRKWCWNWCSFIGTVVLPVKRIAGSDPCRVAYTMLELNSPSSVSDRFPLRISLVMSGKLAEVSLQHLKPNDFIYVSGPLGSYEMVNGSGKRETYFKVYVRDLNYVKRNDENMKPASSKAEKVAVPTSISGALDQQRVPSSSVLDNEKECVDRLHLWQVFFANPIEWWDNRQGKQNLRSPDFKHKDTRESLWLNPGDPPWIKKQLQLYDSKKQDSHQRGLGGRLHDWNLEDL